MPAKHSKGPGWSDVKARVAQLDQRELVKLAGDLYRLSKENRDFLHARFQTGGDPLKPYVDTVEYCMYVDMMSDRPIQIAKAKKAISQYVKAVGDPLGEVELMTRFVECGNRFTLEFGDIDEPFYMALESMFERVVKKVKKLHAEQREAYRERFEAIQESCQGIGWGYGDSMPDIYHRYFPDQT